ncbi:hypothetical protein L6452_02428 [Arctium lappa]|uniref:Uncharacterized protein n=1 Tax=Arctium lappa TaxID=4217 RepID=A0ACB9FK12_ARCLA|nr:hypothetical protein L6452_02428 [Arctium lappa]
MRVLWLGANIDHLAMRVLWLGANIDHLAKLVSEKLVMKRRVAFEETDSGKQSCSKSHSLLIQLQSSFSKLRRWTMFLPFVPGAITLGLGT